MRLGLVSDTHDAIGLSRIAASFLRDAGCGLVLHLGDVTTAACIEPFADLPLRVLEGNNDPPALLRALQKRGIPCGPSWEGVIEGVKVAAHHGHLAARWSEEPDLLVHGHTHRSRAERVGRTLVVNPGALHRANVKTVALAELPTMRVSFYEVKPEGVSRLRASSP